MRLQTRILPGGRLHLHDGPIDLIITAAGEGVPDAFRAAQMRAATLLDELCAELPALRRGAPVTGAVARRMADAVRPHQGVTPMAAVAGAVAEAVLAAMLAAAPLRQAIVNNGGDIALHGPARIGLVDRPDLRPPAGPSLIGRVAVGAADGIGGVATSGFGGRSHTLGIANAVTILAATAAGADAAATVVANAVDLPGHAAIQRVPARSLDPDSDLGCRLVTRAVGPLGAAEIGRALEAGRHTAAGLLDAGLIRGACLHLRGHTLTVGRPALALAA